MSIRGLIHLAFATVISAGAAQAQQREAVLQRVEVAKADFHVVIATAKPGSPMVDFREDPDPNVVYLPAGDLVFAYTGGREDREEEAILASPVCTFNVERRGSIPRTAVVIYAVPKGTIPLSR